MDEDQETPQEEKLTLKSLNKNFQEFKEEVFKRLPMQPLVPVHGVRPAEALPEDIAIPETPASESITFFFKARFAEPRIFTAEGHGNDWREIANEFQRVNADTIKRREDI